MPDLTLTAAEAIRNAFAFEIVIGASSTTQRAAHFASRGMTAFNPGMWERLESSRLFVLTVNPEKYSFQKPQASTAQPAQGVVFPDDVGFATGTITISGRFGAKEKAGYNRRGQSESLKGHEQFLEFEAFLDYYSDLSAGHQNVELHFHALRYNHHFAVIPVSFELDKQRNTRIGSPKYQLRLRTFRKLGADDIPSSLLDRGLFGTTGGGLQDLADAVDEAADLARTIHAEIHRKIPQAVAAWVNKALDWCDDMLVEFGVLWRTGLAILAVPILWLDETIRLIERATWEMALLLHAADDTMNIAKSLYPRMKNLGEAFKQIRIMSSLKTRQEGPVERTLRQIRADANSSDEYRTVLMDAAFADGEADADGASTDSATATRARAITGGIETTSDVMMRDAVARFERYAGWFPYVVREGDNPYSIAAAQYGDPQRWIDVVLANKLVHPYFGRGDSVAEPGDIIRIPTLGPGPAIPFAYEVDEFPSFNEDLLERIYGVDVALEYTPEGLLDIALSPDLEDIELVAGFPAFIQRLRDVILRTERGSNVLFPNAGVVYRIGHQNLPEQSMLAAVSAREAITLESAVLDIRDERVVTRGDSIAVEFDVEVLAGGPVTLKRVITP